MICTCATQSDEPWRPHAPHCLALGIGGDHSESSRGEGIDKGLPEIVRMLENSINEVERKIEKAAAALHVRIQMLEARFDELEREHNTPFTSPAPGPDRLTVKWSDPDAINLYRASPPTVETWKPKVEPVDPGIPARALKHGSIK